MRELRSARWLVLSLLVASVLVLYWGVISKLVADWWADENYSHGFLVAPFAAYVVWQKRHELSRLPARPSLGGLVLILVSLAVLAAGVLGAELFLARIALLSTLAGCVIFLWGAGHFRALLFVFLLLLLAIPLPAMIFNRVVFPLQLLASRLGEFSIAACGIPVLRQGNMIVLSNITLEVVEACSGIRSLFSLISVAIIWGYLWRSPVWLSWLLALSAVPIAIVANGLRVAGTGIASHALGAEAARGFFHSFLGWFVFVVAGILLFLVYRLAVRLFPDAARAREEQPAGDAAAPPAGGASMVTRRAFVAACCLLAASVALRAATRAEATPLRQPLAGLPMEIGGWSGKDGPRFGSEVEPVLGVSEYITRVYAALGRPSLNLYIGYYASQRQAQTVHSPLSGMPGAGWEPAGQRTVALSVPGPSPGTDRRVEVNRMIVQRGPDRLVALYWYQAHGRIVASEYWSRIYAVVDAIRLNRSDGAIVRLLVRVDGNGADKEREADAAVERFAVALLPLLGAHVPD